MPYVSNYRTQDYIFGGNTRTVKTVGGSLTVSENEVRTPALLEAVYSWRTGKYVVSDPPVSPQSPSRRDSWGIDTPRSNGSLAEKIADRSRYYDQVMRANFTAETASGSMSVDRTSKTDAGHVFQKLTYVKHPIRAQFEWRDNTLPSYGTSYVGTCFLQNIISPAQATGDRTFPFTTRSVSLLSPTEKQGMYNRYFAATTPDRQDAALLVTLLELLRGDIPSVLRNFRKAALKFRAADTRAYQRRSSHRKYKDVVNYYGGEYLNVVFGWSPLISELAGLLKVLITIDRMVYSETNRRKRRWTGPYTRTTVEETSNYGLYTSSVASYREFDILKGINHSPIIGSARYDLTTFRSEDYHLSSRYSSLAKPDSASNGFVERAEDVLARLGLVDDPTLLWELVPWSWLVDWVVNIGHSLTNARTYSPLTGKHAVDYCYVTTSFVEQRDAAVKQITLDPRTKVFIPQRGKSFELSTSKNRNRATPFGFGTQLGSLSASQFAILVALGMAQTR